MSLSTNLSDYLEGGVYVQRTIRKMWERMGQDDFLYEVCEEVESFRDSAEKEALLMVESGLDQENVAAYRKKANNVVNDVSRQCRDLCGYSIKATGRGLGNYNYKAHASPPKTPLMEPEWDADKIEKLVDTVLSSGKSESETCREFAKAHPDVVLGWILAEHRDNFTEILKEVVANSEEA